MNFWPQVLVAGLMIFLVIGGIVRHGKPISPTPINAGQIIWITFTFCAVLGAGGFWNVFR